MSDTTDTLRERLERAERERDGAEQAAESFETLYKRVYERAMRLESALEKHGVCPQCLVPYEHEIEAPFAWCGCGPAVEWAYQDTSTLPTIMRWQIESEELKAENRRLRNIREAAVDVMGNGIDMGDYVAVTPRAFNRLVGALEIPAAQPAEQEDSHD